MPRDESDEKAERTLLEAYKDRDELVEALKYATGSKLAEGQALLRELDKSIDAAEAATADVQETSARLDTALDHRRALAIDMLNKLDALEKEPTAPQAVLDMIPSTREETLRFLRLDAEERGIPDDDH